MKKAVYPGSFDPITLGHVDIIERASSFVSELHILIADNYRKSYTFTNEERIEMTRKALSHLDNVVVSYSGGLVVDYAKENGCDLIIRGLRNIADYENEYQLFQLNKNINEDIETIVLFPSSRNQAVSSSAVKELLIHNGDITKYVPKIIINDILTKFKNKLY